jgi:hypothetical protein
MAWPTVAADARPIAANEAHDVHDHDHADGPAHGHSHRHESRRSVLRSGLAAGMTAALPRRLAWANAPGVASDMARAAGTWLSRLDQRQRREAQLEWVSRLRENWHYVPRSRPGITFRAMDATQSAAAWDLLGALLSMRGLDQVRGLITLERILGELTGAASFRDPGNYALVVFGDPAGSAPWAWRFEGHHLSISVLVAPEHGVAVTPVFFGANPAHVPRGHAHAGFRLVGAEEDAAFSLIQSLDGGGRTRAVIADRSLGDIVAGPGREASLQRYEGVSLAQLNVAQQDGIMRILELYAGTMREEIATAAMATVREAGLDALHFAWAGSLVRGRPHYFRVHGPAALIEYDNTQDGANHVHSVWIDPRDLFGRDLLLTHYRGAH